MLKHVFFWGVSICLLTPTAWGVVQINDFSADLSNFIDIGGISQANILNKVHITNQQSADDDAFQNQFIRLKQSGLATSDNASVDLLQNILSGGHQQQDTDGGMVHGQSLSFLGNQLVGRVGGASDSLAVIGANLKQRQSFDGGSVSESSSIKGDSVINYVGLATSEGQVFGEIVGATSQGQWLNE